MLESSWVGVGCRWGGVGAAFCRGGVGVGCRWGGVGAAFCRGGVGVGCRWGGGVVGLAATICVRFGTLNWRSDNAFA